MIGILRAQNTKSDAGVTLFEFGQTVLCRNRRALPTPVLSQNNFAVKFTGALDGPQIGVQ